MVNGNNRTEPGLELYLVRSHRKLHFSANGLTAQRKSKQGSVGGEGPPAFHILQPRVNLQRALGNLHVNTIKAHRAPLRGKIRHGVSSRRGRQAKAAVQESVPDARRRLVVAEAQDLNVV